MDALAGRELLQVNGDRMRNSLATSWNDEKLIDCHEENADNESSIAGLVDLCSSLRSFEASCVDKACDSSSRAGCG